MSGRSSGRSAPHYTFDGVLFILSLVLVAAFVALQFRGKLTPSVDVDLLAQRSGLNLEPGTRVKLLDVQVGRIAKVEEVDGFAKIALDLFPDQVGSIPANVDATIDSTTVFGAKYVNLHLPKDPSNKSISAGDTIDARHVTPELNSLFERLTTVLKAISPEDLNATLTAVSDAFRGRGEQVGNTLVNADAYLNALRPSLDNLQRDVRATADVTNIYADAAPSLLGSIESLTTTGSTIVEKSGDLDRFLLAAIDFGNSGSQVLTDNEKVIADLMRNLVPTTELLDEYSPVFPCFFQGLDEARAGVEKAVGGTVPGFNISGTLLAGDMPYRYPRDVPVVAASGGPRCGRLPSLDMADGPAPYLVTNTGVNPFAPTGRPAQLNVLDFMLYGVPGGLR